MTSVIKPSPFKTALLSGVFVTMLLGVSPLAVSPQVAYAAEEDVATEAETATETDATASFTDAQKTEMGAIINDYIMENPTLIIEAMEAYRDQEEENKRLSAAAAIQTNIDKLYASNGTAIGASAENAKVTIVEFFDYNCGYCKRALPAVQAIADTDKTVRFVFKEMPILGETSRTAALWALAAARQDKYFEFHTAVMEFRGPKEADQLEAIALEIGLDVDQMKKDIASDSLKAEIDADIALAREVGVTGTPAFIIGDEFVPGYVDEDTMRKLIDEQRS